MPPYDNTTPHQSFVYDMQVRTTIPYYDLFHQEVIQLVRHRPSPRRWLDTGAGTGTLVARAAVEFPDTAFSLADPSAEMLQVAREKLSALPADRLNLLDPAPTQALPAGLFGAFDVVTAIQAHHYLSPEERWAATQVCYELLVPDGLYIMFENIRPLTVEGTRLGLANWRHFQITQGKAIAEADSHLQRFDVEFHPLTVEEHLTLLRNCGFAVRPLLYGDKQQAGTHSLFGDGLDRDGHAQPAGMYEWRVLRTPGFAREFLLDLGVNITWREHDYWPGNHYNVSSLSSTAPVRAAVTNPTCWKETLPTGVV